MDPVSRTADGRFLTPRIAEQIDAQMFLRSLG